MSGTIFSPVSQSNMVLNCVERALILQYISHASVQAAHVQCFTLLSSYLCSVNCLPQAWVLIGQAVRSAQDLGLHVCGGGGLCVIDVQLITKFL
jgi:pyridoxine 5'-phosphate synthase PdxJ